MVYTSRGLDLYVKPLGARAETPLLVDGISKDPRGFSPDGKWLAYMSDESGQPEVYVTSFPSGAGKWQISTGGGTMPRWRHDGKAMFYLSADRKMMSAKVNGAGAAFTVAAAETLFQTNALPGPGSSFDVSLDGQRFLINSTIRSNVPPSLTIVVNWPASIRT